MKYLVPISAMCIAVAHILPAGAEVDQVDLQTVERIPDHLAYLYSRTDSHDNNGAMKQLYADKRRWENGRRLRVCFFGANPVVAKLIRTVASEWSTDIGLVIDFGPQGTWLNCRSPSVGFPEIRIGFSDRGYWSYIGSDSERYAVEQAPSMNLDGFNRIYSEFRYSVADVVEKAAPYHKATIRHEFGHALGLLHEHQNEALNCHNEIKWEGVGNVYDYFLGSPNYWQKEDVDRNLGFIAATDPDYVAGEPDPKSIMMYSLPHSIFKDAEKSKCAVPVNHEISFKDKAIVAKIYPANRVDKPLAAIPEDIDAAFIKAAPLFISENDSEDYLKRVVTDLESEDIAIRRNARARLTQVVSDNLVANEVNQLVLSVDKGSYSYKLGVATALGQSNQKVELSPSASMALSNMYSAEGDQKLKSALKSAKENIVNKE